MNLDQLFEKPFTWDSRRHFLELIPQTQQVKFALFCAKQVEHYLEDEVGLNAIRVVELYLKGKATREECAAATTAAYAAAYTAAYAAATAAYAAANNPNIKQDQMNYLRELILDSLSPEDRECWLLVVSV